ncbi:hypothetical protein [Streptomyces kurssanovii]|uniref:PH domain-containing protein n=1 Tax=Streptomyces kurssanovii TaxID=67312 RepID=A0ABV3HX59_9ACTN
MTSLSAQLLRGHRVQTSFDSETVEIVRDGQRTRIPLSAVQEICVPAPRTIEIVLTSGVRHRIAGPNPTATTAFATALSGALPTERDPDAAAAVTTESEPNQGIPWKLLSLLGAPVVAFIGYVTWVGIARGSDGAFAALLGGPFILIGLALVAYAVEDVHRRAVLHRHGITVRAERTRPGVFTYVTADGVARTYRIKRQLLAINLIHDPRKPHFVAHVSPWYFVAVRLFLVLAAGIGIGALGGTVSFHTAWLPDTE